MGLEIDLVPVERTSRSGRFAGEGNWYSHKADVLWLEDNDDGDELGRNAIHELSHFLLHCSTPYGFFIDELSELQRHCVVLYCTKHKKHIDEQIVFPLRDLAQIGKNDEARFLKMLSKPKLVQGLLNDCIGPWSRSVFLEDLCEGENFESVRQAKDADAILALARVENFEGTTKRDEELFERFVDADSLESAWPVLDALGSKIEEFVPPSRGQPLRPSLEIEVERRTGLRNLPRSAFTDAFGDKFSFACPTLKLETNPEPVGARHIFEGVAQRIEHRSPKVISAQYFGLWTQTVIAYGVKRIDSEEHFKRVHNTFLALCDLALFVPAGTVYGRLRTSSTSWWDVQPGFRFNRALTRMRHHGWIDNLDDDLNSLQDAICDDLGWPKPDAFFRIACSLKPKTDHCRRHREACELRQSHRGIFLEPDYDRKELEDFLANNFPISRSPGSSSILIRGSTEARAGRILQYFLAQYCWNIVMSDRLEADALISEQVDFTEVFSNIADHGDMLDMIFKAVPQMRPENFRPLASL